VGMGVPDIKVYKYWQMEHRYKFMRKYNDKVPLGIAVQWGDYDEINPKTKKQVTIEDIHQFGENEIGVDYLFWSTQEPYYSDYLIPYLEKNKTVSNAAVQVRFVVV